MSACALTLTRRTCKLRKTKCRQHSHHQKCSSSHAKMLFAVHRASLIATLSRWQFSRHIRSSPSSGIVGGSNIRSSPSSGIVGGSNIRSSPSSGIVGGSNIRYSPSSGIVGGSNIRYSTSSGIVGGSNIRYSTSSGIVGGSNIRYSTSSGIVGGRNIRYSTSSGIVGGSNSNRTIISDSIAKLSSSGKLDADDLTMSDNVGGPGQPDVAPHGVDLTKLRLGRLARVHKQLRARGLSACLLVDPVNIHYSTGARNMKPFHLRNPSRYTLTITDGPTYLFEFSGCQFLADDLPTIDRVEAAVPVSFVASGSRLREVASRWADQVTSILDRECGHLGAHRLGVERLSCEAVQALQSRGVAIEDAQAAIEVARSVKSPEELLCAQASLDSAADAVRRVRDATRPGMTENQLWSLLHAEVIAAGGEYVETRLMSTGRRTNPWMQECSNKVIAEGELVALDTDIVGLCGYYADFSRTWLCGDRPTAGQRDLYRYAYEQLQHDMAQIRPGMTLRQLSDAAWSIPDRFVTNRYFVLAHGVGMSGEFPYVLHRQDFDEFGYDGIIEPNMTLCVEAYIGEEGGLEGVKLEEQLVVTETGTRLMSNFPFESNLML